MKNREKKIYTIATAHLDTFWLWTFEKTVSAFIPATLKENFELFERFPDYKFNFEGSRRYELMEEYYPQQFSRLSHYIREGRWHPCGACYENGDVNTPSPEALIRNILYGNGYFREKFGVESNDIFLPDCFGFGKALPSLAAHSGLVGFSTQKLTWGGSVDVPFDIGIWKGKDGKGLWCALKPGNYASIAGNVRKRKDVILRLQENSDKFGNPRTFVYHGTGDRGGAPAAASVRAIAKAMKKNSLEDVKVLFSTTKEFFDEIENLSDEEKRALPVFDGELLLTEHGAGSYTSRTVTKRWNRRCELLADAAERFSFAAFSRGGYAYPQYAFDKAGKNVIAHQFHDDITGTSFEECYKSSHNDYVQAMNTFSEEYTASVAALSSEVDTSFVKGIAVAVSNPVQNTDKRVQRVYADIASDNKAPFVRVYDSEGREVASQKRILENGKIRVSFMAEASSCSVAVYDVRFSDEKSTVETELKFDGKTLENKNLAVTFDENGDIASVVHKKTDTQALKKSIRMAVLHDVDSYAWPAWEVKLSDLSREPYMYPENPVITVEEEGAAVCVIKIQKKAGSSVFIQRVSLDAESEYVSVENEVDWREEASLLKAEFSLNVSNEKARYDIGFGYTERSTNTERLFEVPAQKWAGIADDKSCFAVSVFSDSRTGWDKPDESTLRLSCIHTPLNNYRWECSQHLMDMGLNRFSFAIYPNEGATEEIISRADEFCQPMHTFVCGKHQGALKNGYTAVKINTDKVRITALKKAQEDDRAIIRVCEYTGEAFNGVEIELSEKIEKLYEVRGDEKEIAEIEVKDGKLCFDIGANEIKSFAVSFAESKKAASENQKSAELPFNAVAVTTNESRRIATLYKGVSIPRELLPDSLAASGVEYKFSKEEKNGLICQGQTLIFEKGFEAVSLLITSLNGDCKVDFRVGEEAVSATVQDFAEPLGQWDLMRSRQTGYIKPLPQLLSLSHTHSLEGDIPAKQFYLFRADVPLRGGCSITLPENEKILILSATLIKNERIFEKASQHFDSLEKREFDYSFSSYAEKASKPSKTEVFLDRLLDRTESPSIRAFNMYSKLSLGELYYYLRNISALIMYPSRKKKMLSRKKNSKG